VQPQVPISRAMSIEVTRIAPRKRCIDVTMTAVRRLVNGDACFVAQLTIARQSGPRYIFLHCDAVL
jgi:hypothetical protein